jgi:pimeloyl-ACP methyl ester carboxylesterase
VPSHLTDIPIAYDDVGSGLAVLLLHGFPHHRGIWEPQLGGIAGDVRVIAPDLRGFGESGVAPPFTIDQYADDAADLLDALQVRQAVIGGLSMGGYVALAFWRRHRDRVRAMILTDTRAGADSAEGLAARREMLAMARQRGSAAVADAMITGMLGKTTREKSPELVDAVHHMLESAPVEGVIGALEAMMARPDSGPTLATIDLPVLIVVGEEDALTPVKEARAMHDAVRGSRLEVIPRAGHVSNFERPSAFNHVVSEFLAAVTLA